MKRIIVLLVVSTILVVALSAPAMAKNSKVVGYREPVQSGNVQNPVMHCGPHFGISNVHGAQSSGDNGQGGNCVVAPPPKEA